MRWTTAKGSVDNYVNTSAIFILTLLGTIFASEYLPNVITQTATDGLSAGLFIAGAGLFTLKLIHSILGDSECKAGQKEVAKFLEPLAIFILSLVGTIFASEYLPRIMDIHVAQGIAATIGMTGFMGAIASLSHKCMHEEIRTKHKNPNDAYVIAFKKLELARDTKAGLLSWWVPLTIMMLTISLGIYEGTVDGSAYLIPTSTLVGTLLMITHIVHTCLTTRNDQELRVAAKSEITHDSSDPIPSHGS